MTSYLRFVGHSSSEGPPTIIFQHRGDRYLFNCREGTQRQCVEDKIKLSKVKSIFLTRNQWECVGGLPGMLLTSTDAGAQDINIYGAKNLTHFVVSTRHFVYRTSTTVKCHEFGESVDQYEDSALKVKPVLISAPYTGKKRSFNESESSSTSSSSDYSPSSSEEDSIKEHYYKNKKEIMEGKEEANNNEMEDIFSTMKDHAYRNYVLSQMFNPNANQEQQRQKKSDSGIPEHTIEAPCTPRVSRHPLADASIQFKQERENQPSKAIVDPIPPSTEMDTDTTTTTANSNDNNNNNNNNNQRISEDYLARSLPRTSPDHTCISYICQTASQIGKFRPDKAKKLNIPMGPLWGKLQRNPSITLDDGTIITHDQVCDPDLPGSIFMIIDCPSVHRIDGLISSPEFELYQNTTDPNYIPKVIIHLVDDNVLANSKYREWMNKFSPETEHVISSEGYCAQSTIFRSHALSQYKLSQLDGQIFKIPEYNNTPKLSLTQFNDLPPKVYPLFNKTRFSLDPKKGLEKTMDETPPFDVKNKDKDMIEFDQNKEFQQAIQEAKQNSKEMSSIKPFPGDDVQVITLGTGSSIPSKYRNVSATLIKIPRFGSLLLDAGEGTYGQMLRYFGQDNIEKEINDLRCIFVSHLHADHHLGVIQLLTKRKKFNHHKQPIFVIGPFIFQRWMMEYNDVQHIGNSRQVIFIRANQLFKNNDILPHNRQNIELLKKVFGLAEIESVFVKHCRWAYGLALTHKSGWKLVYSGDTRPCQRLIDVGKDATLLIHEATLEDGMLDLAIYKRHSTTSEAIEVGQKMNARYTLLNHFSQRYAKIPTLSEEQSNACFSFDLMSVKMKQIPLLPKYTKALQLIFQEEEEEGDGDDIDMDNIDDIEDKKKKDAKKKKQK